MIHLLRNALRFKGRVKRDLFRNFPSIKPLERENIFSRYFREGCRASEELFWKLTVLQQFIAELNWPDEVLASHLMKRLKLMASDMVQSCVKRCELAIITNRILPLVRFHRFASVLGRIQPPSTKKHLNFRNHVGSTLFNK